MPVEGKPGEAVVKSDVINFGRTPIKGSVAGRAVGAEHPRVTVWLFMAGCAVCFCRGERIGAVALFTFQRAMFTHQWKTGKRMVKRCQGGFRRIELAAFMFLVACGTGARLFQPAVQAIAQLYLSTDVFVAVQTLGCLVRLEGCVTEAALGLKIGMGVKTSQLNPNCFFCTDRARIKDQPTSKPQSTPKN
jgi:hypothetical protein